MNITIVKSIATSKSTDVKKNGEATGQKYSATIGFLVDAGGKSLIVTKDELAEMCLDDKVTTTNFDIRPITKTGSFMVIPRKGETSLHADEMKITRRQLKEAIENGQVKAEISKDMAKVMASKVRAEGTGSKKSTKSPEEVKAQMREILNARKLAAEKVAKAKAAPTDEEAPKAKAKAKK